MIRQSIILASKSPRRKFLLEQADIKFKVIGYDVEENVPNDLPIEEAPEYLSLKKGRYAMEQLQTDQIVLAADTSVFSKQEILNKPEDRSVAIEMLRKLSDHKHSVITGVTLITQNKIESFSVKSEVLLDEISDAELDYYVDNYKPYDKAGSYGIQDWIGWVKIKSITGSYSNILGLPIREVYQSLLKF